MAAKSLVIQIQPGSELALVVRDAAQTGEIVLLDTGDERYEIEVHLVPRSKSPEEDFAQDSLFSIIGISTEGEPTDIARNKRAYLAEALSPKPR